MRDLDKAVVIVNPVAGNGRAGGRLPVFKGAFAADAAGVFVTLRPGDAEKWARTFRQHPGVVVIGGDGTLHEVLNGMDLKRQKLGILPVGSAVSLGRDLGKPDLARLLVAITETGPRAVDVIAMSLRYSSGRRIRRYAAATVGIGYPVALQARAERDLPDVGPLALPLAAAYEGLASERFSAAVSVDGAKPRKLKLTGLLINNTRHACGVPLFPGASIADRHLDVMELTAGPVRQAFHNLSVFSRMHVYVPAVVRQARRVSVTLDRPRDLMADGEVYSGVIAADFRILPGRLQLWIPAGARIGG